MVIVLLTVHSHTLRIIIMRGNQAPMHPQFFGFGHCIRRLMMNARKEPIGKQKPIVASFCLWRAYRAPKQFLKTGRHIIIISSMCIYTTTKKRGRFEEIVRNYKRVRYCCGVMAGTPLKCPLALLLKIKYVLKHKKLLAMGFSFAEKRSSSGKPHLEEKRVGGWFCSFTWQRSTNWNWTKSKIVVI